MDLDLPRSTASVALLLAHGRERGLTDATMLAGTGLSPTVVADPAAEVTGRQELAVLEALAEADDDPVGAGLALGARYHVTTYGIYGFALVSSPTLREAITVGLRYLSLTFILVDLRFRETGDRATLELSAGSLPEGPVRDLVLARDAAAIVTLRADLGIEAAALRGVSLAVPSPHDPVRADVLDGPIGFEARTSEVVLDRAILDRPMPQANPHTAAMCEAQCRDLLARRHRLGGVAGEVRDRLLADPAHMPDMEAVAAERFVTSRTLRRQLADEGTGFRDLVDEVRETLATELLSGAGLTVEETARRLGYAEPAAFIHAFRRWTGMTPGAWRTGRRT